MLLSMDKKGRIYQAASHRADGLGFENVPEVVDERDVYYDNAALDQSRQINADNKELEQFNLLSNMKEEQAAVQAEILKKQARFIQAKKDAILNLPEVQEQMQYDGLMQNMTKSADFNQLEVSGYGLSSDGVMGPTPHERAVEMALMQQMGAATAAETSTVDDVYDVDKYEQEQYQLEILAKSKGLVTGELDYQTQQVQYFNKAEPEVYQLPALEADVNVADKKALVQAQEDAQYKLPFKMTPVTWAMAGVIAYLIYKKK